jgi:hypothetical protein
MKWDEIVELARIALRSMRGTLIAGALIIILFVLVAEFLQR